MENYATLTIPDGYKIVEFEEETDISTVEFLRTKKQRRYTCAHRMGDRVVLKRHVVVCPCCDFRTPAYDRFVKHNLTVYPEQVPKRVIDAWADPQYSFFEEEDTVLTFNKVSIPEGKFECPKCHFRSSPAKQDITISIGIKEQFVLITSSSIDTKAVFQLIMNSYSGKLRLQFPFSETVEFNLKRGRVIYRIVDANNEDVLVRDITNMGDKTVSSMIFKIMVTNNRLRKNFARAFQQAYNFKLPFELRELSPQAYVAMTRFQHFPKEFYDTIPYNLVNGMLDTSFLSTSKHLKNIQNLSELYRVSALPNAKSIRRLFFSNPGFFFYIHEAKLLAGIFSDVNIFASLLSQSHIYDIFSFLHQYPGGISFLQDYAAEKGQLSLKRKIEKNWNAIKEYSKHYSAMSPSAKKREQHGWRGRRVSARPSLHYSIPMKPGFNQIKDHTVVGPYTFSWLRSKSDYIRAGNALKNCLGGWNYDSNPVVIVKKGDQFKAALEIKNSYVMQERACHNAPVEIDKELYQAIIKWKKDHNLTNYYCDEYDEENSFHWF